MTISSRIRLIVLICACATIPATAHHSFDLVFDSKKPVTVTGVVTKIEWSNPHVWYYLTATDARGTAVNWSFEGHSPNLLVRAGWKRDTMKIGEQVTVTGFRARDGSNSANTTSVVRADGSVIYKGLGPGVTGR